MSSLPPEREIYSRAPIVEAVIDIRCVTRSDLTVRELATAVEEAVPDSEEELQTLEITETRSNDGTRTKTERVVGVLRRSADGRRAVQMQLGGASVSRLAPYDRWEAFTQDAKSSWELYLAVAKPEHIKRAAVRYINRLEIGDPEITDLSSWVRVLPVTPWTLSTPPSGYILRVRRPLDDGVMLVLISSTVQHAETKAAALVLDLDVFIERAIAPNEVWNLIERLHVEVEKTFEACITDRVRELIR